MPVAQTSAVATLRLPLRSISKSPHLSRTTTVTFQPVLEIDGKKPAWRSMEDVVNVPPSATVRIAWYPDDRPGSWMYHCHILEHHASGMMGHFDVVR